MSFEDILRQNRRLTVLRALAKAPLYTANHLVLQTALDSAGLLCGEEDILAELDFLQKHNCLKLESLQASNMTISVATLTNKGADVAHGRIFLQGVQRPKPGTR